jgi:hypothetical protein
MNKSFVGREMTSYSRQTLRAAGASKLLKAAHCLAAPPDRLTILQFSAISNDARCESLQAVKRARFEENQRYVTDLRHFKTITKQPKGT